MAFETNLTAFEGSASIRQLRTGLALASRLAADEPRIEAIGGRVRRDRDPDFTTIEFTLEHLSLPGHEEPAFGVRKGAAGYVRPPAADLDAVPFAFVEAACDDRCCSAEDKNAQFVAGEDALGEGGLRPGAALEADPVVAQLAELELQLRMVDEVDADGAPVELRLRDFEHAAVDSDPLRGALCELAALHQRGRTAEDEQVRGGVPVEQTLPEAGRGPPVLDLRAELAADEAAALEGRLVAAAEDGADAVRAPLEVAPPEDRAAERRLDAVRVRDEGGVLDNAGGLDEGEARLRRADGELGGLDRALDELEGDRRALQLPALDSDLGGRRDQSGPGEPGGADALGKDLRLAVAGDRREASATKSVIGRGENRLSEDGDVR